MRRKGVGRYNDVGRSEKVQRGTGEPYDVCIDDEKSKKDAGRLVLAFPEANVYHIPIKKAVHT